MMTQVFQLIAILAGSILIGSEFGWQIGLGIGCISYALMPAEQ